MGSSNETAALPSTLPNKQPTAAETGPLGSIADDDIAEEVEYDEVLNICTERRLSILAESVTSIIYIVIITIC